MGTPSPSELLEALRDWGCDPVTRTGWSTHNRPGLWSPSGVLHHHTAGSKKLLTDAATQEAMRRMLWTGRPDLNGPLCHLNISMVGGTGSARAYLLGYGRANHAGSGSSRTLARIKAGTYAGQAPGPDDTDGNVHWWGLEYSHPGDGVTPWPAALLDIGHRAHCAIAEASAWAQSQWPGRGAEHREWTTRKIDRRWPGDLRTAIRRVSEEKDMPLTTDDVNKTWNTDGMIDNQGSTAATNPKTSGATALESIWDNAKDARAFSKDAVGSADAAADAAKAAAAAATAAAKAATLAASAAIGAKASADEALAELKAVKATGGIAPTAAEVAAEVIKQLTAHPLTPQQT